MFSGIYVRSFNARNRDCRATLNLHCLIVDRALYLQALVAQTVVRQVRKHEPDLALETIRFELHQLQLESRQGGGGGGGGGARDRKATQAAPPIFRPPIVSQSSM